MEMQGRGGCSKAACVTDRCAPADFLVFKWMMNEFIIIEIGQKTEQKIFGNKSCYKHCEKAVGIL